MDLQIWFTVSLLMAHSRVFSEQMPAEADEEKLSIFERRKCFDDIGCVEITREWFHPFKRPLNFLPEDRNVVNTSITMHRKRKSAFSVNLKNLSTFFDSDFDPEASVTILIHGFLDSPSSSWFQDLLNELLEDENLAVFMVDWSKGASPSATFWYTQACGNARLVALEISYLIRFLQKEYGVTASSIHIIGHSLGSHIASYVGYDVKGIKRITGLDPAGIGFAGMHPLVRLDPSDALLVDVIHTDGNNSFGHADFYPNGGFSQPGCPFLELKVIIPDFLVQQFVSTVMCSHLRSLDLYIESINSKTCQFYAFRCHSWSAFYTGSCYNLHTDEVSVTMGHHLDSATFNSGENFYLATSEQPPFCKYHYYIELELTSETKLLELIYGYLRINSLKADSDGIFDVYVTNGDTALERGRKNVILFLGEKNILNATSLNIYWKFVINFVDTVLCFWCKESLFVENISIINYNYNGRFSSLEAIHFPIPDKELQEIESESSLFLTSE